MNDDIDLSPDLRDRIAAIAAHSGASPSEIVADALENGHSLEWQEHFVRKVKAGLVAADRGEFATAEEIEAIKRKYRPS